MADRTGKFVGIYQALPVTSQLWRGMKRDCKLAYQISCYGPLGDLIGRELTIADTAGDTTLAELLARLAADHPEAAALLGGDRLSCAVNGEIATKNYTLGKYAVIEIFPPVSGG